MLTGNRRPHHHPHRHPHLSPPPPSPLPPTPPPPTPPPPSPLPPTPPTPPTPPAPPPPPPTLDVWIVAGGSNAVGENGPWDGESSDPPLNQEEPAAIRMWSIVNQSWAAAVRNVHDVSNKGAAPSSTTGPEIPFARALIAAGASQLVGFIQVSVGGTNLFNNWMPENNEYFQAMINQTRLAMAAAGANARLQGMIMMLGEGDAMTIYNSISAWNPQGIPWAYQYNPLMTRLIATARAQLVQWHPLLPVAISLQAVTDRDRVFPLISVIRDQTQAMLMPNLVMADMEGCPLYSVDFSGFDGYLGIYGWVGWQSIHLSRSGQTCMGQRFAAAYTAGKPHFVTPPGSGGVSSPPPAPGDVASLPRQPPPATPSSVGTLSDPQAWLAAFAPRPR
ncbi:SGNH hydrolase-type esterase domain-containing protein [Haematococcus lacustris]